MQAEEVWTDGRHLGLFADGTLGVSDGVGYVGCLDREQTLDLYKALKGLFETALQPNEWVVMVRCSYLKGGPLHVVTHGEYPTEGAAQAALAEFLKGKTGDGARVARIGDVGRWEITADWWSER